MRFVSKCLVFLTILGLCLTCFRLVRAEDANSQLQGIQGKIQEYEQKISELQGQKKTLASTIAYLNNKIYLTTAQIDKTQQEIIILEDEIAGLSVKIGQLDRSLNEISKILASRISETYKNSHLQQAYLLFSSKNFSALLSRLEYLKAAQINDRAIMFAMEKQKTDYDTQKSLKEQKQTDLEKLEKTLESQKLDLAKNKQDKQVLMETTNNDESRYQKLLTEAKQEIASLLASKFTGKKHVKKGDAIGLMGSTGFSTGPHLHFGVYNLQEKDATKFDYFSDAGNPFDYLASKSIIFETNSCDDVSSRQTKTAGGGSLMWPMNNANITQCYGHTPYAFMYQSRFHNGIDMSSSSDITVIAVDEGEAYFYRGDSSMGNNVRVFHSDGKMTLYLHLQ